MLPYQPAGTPLSAEAETGVVDLRGSAKGAATVAGYLGGPERFSGAVLAVAVASGSVGSGIRFTGAATAVGTTRGSLYKFLAVRATGVGLEVLVSPNRTVRASKVGTEVLVNANDVTARVTRVEAYVSSVVAGEGVVTRVGAEVSGATFEPAVVTKITVEVLAKRVSGGPLILWLF